MDNMIESYGWHEWLCKTNFSFLIGASHPVDMVNRARELKYQSIGINDFDGVYGLARTYRECYEPEASRLHSLKLHYGVEIHTEKDHAKPIWQQKNLVLIARSARGYKNICRLVGFAHRESKNESYVSLEHLGDCDLEDVVALQPMRGIIRIQEDQFIDCHYRKIKEIFDKNFFLVLSRHLHPAEDVWWRKTWNLSREIEIPCLLSQDAFFDRPESKCLQDILLTIRSNKTLEKNKDQLFPNKGRCLHSLKMLDQIYRRFPDYETLLKRSRDLAESCQFQFDELKYSYPQELVPEGHTSQSFLEDLTWREARSRLGEVSDRIKSKVEHELDLIRQLEFADYFLTVWDIVSWARSQNILCQGRGSAANSAVCYCLGITSVNPDNFDLLFERFVSLERGDPPDIDVDFEHERREEVIQYIYRKYGRHRASMVANVITYRSRGALRATGKALGVPDSVLSRLSKKIRTKHFRSKSFQEVMQGDVEFLQPTVNIQLWVALAERLIGYPRHLGIHSGGFMIAQRNLDELVAQEPATMDGRTVVQWCKEDIEALGFFKIDVLSLGMLTALRKAFDWINKMEGLQLGLHNLPEGCPKTYQMIQKADTVGTFQIESRAQMSMLPRLKPENFYDLVIEIAIIRPGPIQGGVVHPYLQRRRDPKKVVYPDERLRPILKNTLGIVIFQEQAMRVAIAVGDFTAGEANELRKNIGAWNITGFEKKLEMWLLKLERGLEKNGIRGEFKEQIMGQLRGFSDYGFPESHAISFALIAYASCYLKCHYPAAFFASVLNSLPMGFYSPHSLLQAAQKDGVEILKLSLNKSSWDSSLERRNGRVAIRLGFRLVRGLSQVGVEGFLKVREERLYRNYEDFVQRSGIYRDDLSALAATDVFAEFGITRSEAIWASEAIPIKPLIDSVEDSVDWQKESRLMRIQRDFQSFRTSLWEHAVQVIRDECWTYPISVKQLVHSKDFGKVPRNYMVDVFGMILIRQAPGSAKGMVFFTLEDENGFINLVFTPQVYQKYYRDLEDQSYICVRGKMQKAGAGHSILVKKVYPHRANSDVVDIDKKRRGTRPQELQKPRNYY